jgi:hypothetical protein
MIYCYCNFIGDRFKVYIKDELLNHKEKIPFISFEEMKEFMEDIKETEVKGLYYCMLNDLDDLLTVFELFENKVHYKKHAKLYITLRNCSVCTHSQSFFV